MTSFSEEHSPHLRERLEPGEQLTGVVAANQQLSMLSGRAVAIGVTDRRLLIQPLGRRGKPDGDPQTLARGDIVEASGGPGGGGWLTLGMAVLNESSVRLKLRTADGQKLKLMLMTGAGMLGRLGGGEDQRAGAQALGEWLAAAEPRG